MVAKHYFRLQYVDFIDTKLHTFEVQWCETFVKHIILTIFKLRIKEEA